MVKIRDCFNRLMAFKPGFNQPILYYLCRHYYEDKKYKKR